MKASDRRAEWGFIKKQTINMAHKKHPSREHKRYVTDLFVDQVEKIDEIARERAEATGKQVSRADIIKEIIDSGLKKYE